MKKLWRKKLALLLASATHVKPYYCEVEYLESTGTQWLDIGTTVNTETDEIELYFQLKETNNYKWFFGEYDTNNRLGLGSGDGENKRNFLYLSTAVKVNDSETYNSMHKFEINSSGAFLDGVKKANYSAFASTSTMYLFNLNIDSSSDYKCKGKAFAFRQKRSGALIRDLIPVLDRNMTPCMYDRVSGELLYNKGTGTFSYGRQIHQLDYIQTIYSADGNAFIDTGYYPNFNTKVEFMASGISADTFAGSSGGTWFTGGRQAYQQKMFGSYYNPSSQNLYFCFSTTLNLSSYSTANMYGDNKKFVLDKTGLYINDTKVVNNTDTTNFTSPATLAIFGLNNNGAIISPTGMKLQYYKVWDNGVLTRDYIPAKDENDVGFMFDRVSHTISDNVGSVPFITGNVVD